MSFLSSLIFSLQQNQRRGWNRFCVEVRGWRGRDEGGGGKVAQTMYAHVTKCKIGKIKGDKKEFSEGGALEMSYDIWEVSSSCTWGEPLGRNGIWEGAE
jgi:hypothetical protein